MSPNKEKQHTIMEKKRIGIIICLVLVLIPCAASENKPISFSADQMSGAAGKKDESTSLKGNAAVTVGSLRISGDLIELTGEDYRYVTATGSVRGVDAEKGYSFTANQLTYDRNTEVASFQGEAKLMDTEHDVEASAGMITYNQKTEIAFLQVDVKLKRKEIDCSSGFALYRRTISMLDLSGSPLVIRDGDEFKADRISVNLDTEYITLDGTVSGVLKDSKKGDDAETPPGDGDGTGNSPKPGETPASTPPASGPEKDKKQ